MIFWMNSVTYGGETGIVIFRRDPVSYGGVTEISTRSGRGIYSCRAPFLPHSRIGELDIAVVMAPGIG